MKFILGYMLLIKNNLKYTKMTSKEYLEELKKIDSEVFYNMEKYSQKTIDVVQETIEQLDRDWEEEPIERDELGAINYEIDILLEVWSKDLQFDIEILKRFDKIIAEWYKDVEFVNMALGIPKHKG